MFRHHLRIAASLLLCCSGACSNDFDKMVAENSSKFSLGFSSVKAMTKHCETDSDFIGKQEYSGTYKVNPEKPSWFPYPRFDNYLVETLKWDGETSPVKSLITIQNQAGELTVTWGVQQNETLSGKIYQDKKFCFHGPINLNVKEGETQAYLYADGQFDEQDPSQIKLTLSLGVTTRRKKDAGPIHLGVKETFSGKLETTTPAALTYQYQSPQHHFQGDLIGDAIQLHVSDTDISIIGQAKTNTPQIRIHWQNSADNVTDVELRDAAQNTLNRFRDCKLQLQRHQSHLLGTLLCQESDANLQARFELTPALIDADFDALN